MFGIELTKVMVESLRKVFVHNGQRTVALEDVSFDAEDGEFIAVVGPSGCGKTTLLQIIDGLMRPTGGRVLIDGAVVKGPGQDRGLVFQEYSLFPWLTVRQNIAFGLEIGGRRDSDAVEKWLKVMGLEGFENCYPYMLSGGMRQRVAIARALAYDPDMLLMDEPFGALDAQTRSLLQTHLLKIWSETRKTVLFVTHSIEEAVFLADRVIVLTARPASVKGIFDITLPRPRDEETKLSTEFVEIRRSIWDSLREEVGI